MHAINKCLHNVCDTHNGNNLSPTVMQPLLGKGVDGKTTVQAPVAGKTAHANKAGLNVRRVVENG